MSKIKVTLPEPLSVLAKINKNLELEIDGPVTQRTLVDALERLYPALNGTIRDSVTQVRRPFVRFFACQQDLSHEPLDQALPQEVLEGREPFLIIGAMAGG